MMIQRWQSVWLLLATIMVALFCFVPMALITPESIEFEDSALLISPTNVPVLMVVDLLVAVLLFIAIFLYKNTHRQKVVTIISMLMIVVIMACELCYKYGWYSGEAGHMELTGSHLLLLGALICAILAYRGIRKDEKLLRAADRLR